MPPSDKPDFHAFTIRYNHLANALKTDVRISAPFSEPLNSPEVPQDLVTAAREYKCIWDTGATNSVISQRVVTECGLQPTGMVRVQTASGTDICETFLVNVFLPNRLVFPTVKVSKGVITEFDVLIGMDIINKGDFAVTHESGKTVFSFRIPAGNEIDFVGNRDQPPTQKIGRNAPCPCGSGLKYKRCCGK